MDVFVEVKQSVSEVPFTITEIYGDGLPKIEGSEPVYDGSIQLVNPITGSTQEFAPSGFYYEDTDGSLGSTTDFRETSVNVVTTGRASAIETDKYIKLEPNLSQGGTLISDVAPAPQLGTVSFADITEDQSYYDGHTTHDVIPTPPVKYFSDQWIDLGPAPAETYTLSFAFSQQGSSGKIQTGTLVATIKGSYGDTQTLTTQATTDDALPLSSGSVVVKAKISRNFSGGGLVFDLSGLAANPDQTAVELHGGNVPDFGQVSGDSQSCVVAQSGFMPSLLQALTQDYQKSTENTSASSTDVANWINSSCSPTMTSSDSLSQALLNVQNAPKQGGLLFSISRAIEKKVKVLFEVTDERTGDTTTREAFIQPNQKSSLISSNSLFHDGPEAGSGDKYLTNPQGNQDYQSTFDQALPSLDRGDKFDVSIDAYQILYHGGSTSGHLTSGYNPWYFDTKSGNSGTDVSGENLMFGSKSSTTFHV
jgi:hypothetical protein